MSKEEIKRLEKLQNALNYNVTLSIKEHFNKAGKLQQFADTATPEELAEQKSAMRGLFGMTGAQATLASLKVTDIFMQVARRVASDDKELAAFLPAGTFEQKDIKIFEKHKLNSLAAVIKAQIQD